MPIRNASRRRASRVWCGRLLCAALLCSAQLGNGGCRDERAAALVARGDRQLAAGQANAARASYEAALARGPDVRAERGLGLALVALGRWDDAYPRLAHYTAKQPDDGAARLGLLTALVAREQLDEARKEVRMLTAKDPDSLEGLLLLGALAEDERSRREALSRLEAWAQRHAQSPAELTRCREALRDELRSNARQAAPKRLNLLQPCWRSVP